MNVLHMTQLVPLGFIFLFFGTGLRVYFMQCCMESKLIYVYIKFAITLGMSKEHSPFRSMRYTALIIEGYVTIYCTVMNIILSICTVHWYLGCSF